MSKSKLIVIVGFLALLAAPSAARAEHGLGIGVQTLLGEAGLGLGIGTGPTGAAITYDAGLFHIDGIFGLYDVNNGGDTSIHMAGRFWYMVHEKGVSDLSVGGSLGLINEANTDVYIEGGAKIRIWLVSNVSFSTMLGLGFVITGNDNEDNRFALSGLLNGSIGVTYHFE